jgi:hypothetical protein
MKWLYVTIGLLATSACLIAWIYLRDRDTNWRPPEHQSGQVATVVALNRRASQPQLPLQTRRRPVTRVEGDAEGDRPAHA